MYNTYMDSGNILCFQYMAYLLCVTELLGSRTSWIYLVSHPFITVLIVGDGLGCPDNQPFRKPKDLFPQLLGVLPSLGVSAAEKPRVVPSSPFPSHVWVLWTHPVNLLHVNLRLSASAFLGTHPAAAPLYFLALQAWTLDLGKLFSNYLGEWDCASVINQAH